MTESSPNRGQSSPIGVVLILGLTLAAAVGIVVVGGDAIQGVQSESEIGQAEQAMTQFDARAAQVALGESDSQTVPLGGQGGTYSVEEDVGQVRILHEDWNGTECGSCSDYASLDNTTDNGNTTILYDRTLGAVIYESEGTQVAYQGGGVWRKDPEGDSRPVSSPEFHYRDATLTFPLVRVEGSDSASGQVRANVQRVETAKDIYPNRSATYPDGEEGLLNPVEQGNVSVEITSDYCEGWRIYFEDRTEGKVSECNDGTVTADIVALGAQGEFDITGGSGIPMRGQDPGHTMKELDFQFRTGDDTSSDFNNFEWSMAGEDGDKQFEVFIEGGGGSDCGDPVRTVVYYSEDGGDNYHTWVLDDTRGTDPYTITCPDGYDILNVDLLDDTREFQYTDSANHGNNDLLQFDDEGSFHNDENFTEHGADPKVTYGSGDQEPVELVVQHYYAKLGDVDLTMEEKPQGASALDDDSVGDIEYLGGGSVVTYLHVTENRVRVELSA